MVNCYPPGEECKPGELKIEQVKTVKPLYIASIQLMSFSRLYKEVGMILCTDGVGE